MSRSPSIVRTGESYKIQSHAANKKTHLKNGM